MRSDYEPCHKFDRPITAYIYDNVIMVSGQDDEVSDGMGNSVARVGRRLISEDDQGFVDSVRLPTVAAAVKEFERRTPYYEMEDADEF